MLVVGQCGNQVGYRFWDLALREHASVNKVIKLQMILIQRSLIDTGSDIQICGLKNDTKCFPFACMRPGWQSTEAFGSRLIT